MKILLLIPYPLKEAPSQRFRFEQYLNLLTANHFEVFHQSFWDKGTWAVLYKPAFRLQKTIGFVKGLVGRLTIFFRLPGIDYVFIHRECLPIGPPVVEWFIANVFRKKIIYDFDDAIWIPNTSEENKLVAFLKWHSKVASICRWSYKVSCGNSFLAAYARQFNTNVVVNPTTVDTRGLHNPALYSVQKKSDSIVIGWTGTQSTLPYLLSLLPVLEKLEAKFKGYVRLIIIANKDPELKMNFVEFKSWSPLTEIEDLLQFDIGLMPLTDDLWARGKCGFKALQYLSLGIPAVVSPVGVNSEIVVHGVTGFLCKSETDWIQYLETLIRDAVLRKKMGESGRKKVEEHYSVSSNSSTFLGLFS